MGKNLKIFTNNIEQSAKEQIDLLLEQEPFKDCKVRIMPDVHTGAGCVIGFTGNLGDKVIPNIVGVDIGCGMLCVNLGKEELDLDKIDNIIRKYVPSGMNVH
jgi:RNA-splicing ligase RtcB